MTIKQIALLTAKAGMKRDAFIRRYEDGHVPLILQVLPMFDDYRRSYIVPESSLLLKHIEGAAPAFPYDAVTELRLTGEVALTDLKARATGGDAGEQIARNEKYLLDRSRLVMFGADERRTDPTRLAPRPAGHAGPPAVKMLLFLDTRAGMSRDAFIARYENGHAELAMRLLVARGKPLFAGYVRNYPIPGERFPVGTSEPDTPLGFNVMTEISFWTDVDWQSFLEQCAQPDIGAALAEDEALIFDRSTIRLLHVEEYVSPGLPKTTL